MAFTCTENFDSYANTTDLNGASGGSGWSANWVSDAATITNSTYSSSPNSTTALTGTSHRHFSSVDTGILYFSFKTTGNHHILGLYDGVLGESLVYLTVRSGNLNTYSVANGYESVGAISFDVWHTIGIELDQTNQAFKVRYNIDGGAWSGWFPRVLGDTYTSVAELRFWSDEYAEHGVASVYIDSISPAATATTVTPTSTLAFLGCG
jgi:hypothetical protein